MHLILTDDNIIATYSWDFGEAPMVVELNPTHYLHTVGVYEINIISNR